MRIFFSFFSILLCLSINCLSQIHFKDPEGLLHYQIDLKTKELFKERLSGKFEKVGRLEFRNIKFQDIPNNPTIYAYNEKLAILMTVEGSGQVYRLNKDSLTFERLDKTFFRGYNFAPIQFFRKDTIHSVGGNGFWHAHNIETYYSIKNKEWELINAPSEESPKWMKNDFGGYDPQRDLISVIEFPSIYHKSSQPSTMRYFEKKFTDRKWEYKGDLNSSLLFSLGLKTLNSTFVCGKFLFFNGSVLVWADPSTNEIYQLKNVDDHFNAFYEYSAKDDLIYTYYHEKIGDRIRIDSISIRELKSLSKYKGQFYSTQNFLIEWIIGVIVFALSLTLIYFSNKRRRNNEKPVMDKKMKLEGLPAGSSIFLIECLSHPIGYTFSSQLFTEMMGYGSYAYETQRQVRSQLIKNINAYFWAHYRMDDVIIRSKAKDDKRFYTYKISVKHYNELVKLLIK